MILLLAFVFSSCCGSVLKIQVNYPGPANLVLRGDNCGLSWYQDTPLSASGNVFSTVVTCNSSVSTLQFKAMNSGVWQVGANERVSASASIVNTFPWFGSQNGTYQIMASLTSHRLGNTRDVIVYLPPSYSENTLKRYSNVIVMHDGQNLFNDSTSFAGIAWNIQNAIDSLTINGVIQEMIVVGLYNTPNRDNEYTYSKDPSEGFGGEGGKYIDWIEAAVIPWANKNLRINATKYGMIGSSLGGLISCYAGWTRPHIWGTTGCMSSSFWWNSQDFNSTILALPAPSLPKTIYIDTGTDEGSEPAVQVQQTKTVVDTIWSKGWTLNDNLYLYLDEGGQHNEYFWGRRFHHVLEALFSF